MESSATPAHARLAALLERIPGRRFVYEAVFALLSLGLLIWVTRDAFGTRIATFSAGSDYWEHAAALRALLENPFHPEHPMVKAEAPSPRFSPHFLLLALLGRAFGANALGAMGIAALVNTLLLLTGIFLFFKEYFRDVRAPLY